MCYRSRSSELLCCFLIYKKKHEWICVWVDLHAVNAQTIQTTWKVTSGGKKNKWCLLRILGNRKDWPLQGGSWSSFPTKKKPSRCSSKGKNECVHNFILLVSSEMLCLRSFHCNHGVPWWLIDTQGAIHFFIGCVRGRADGTSAPTTNPLCKYMGNVCALHYQHGFTDFSLLSDFILLQ